MILPWAEMFLGGALGALVVIWFKVRSDLFLLRELAVSQKKLRESEDTLKESTSLANELKASNQMINDKLSAIVRELSVPIDSGWQWLGGHPGNTCSSLQEQVKLLIDRAMQKCAGLDQVRIELEKKLVKDQSLHDQRVIELQLIQEQEKQKMISDFDESSEQLALSVRSAVLAELSSDLVKLSGNLKYFQGLVKEFCADIRSLADEDQISLLPVPDDLTETQVFEFYLAELKRVVELSRKRWQKAADDLQNALSVKTRQYKDLEAQLAKNIASADGVNQQNKLDDLKSEVDMTPTDIRVEQHFDNTVSEEPIIEICEPQQHLPSQLIVSSGPAGVTEALATAVTSRLNSNDALNFLANSVQAPCSEEGVIRDILEGVGAIACSSDISFEKIDALFFDGVPSYNPENDPFLKWLRLPAVSKVCALQILSQEYSKPYGTDPRWSADCAVVKTALELVARVIPNFQCETPEAMFEKMLAEERGNYTVDKKVVNAVKKILVTSFFGKARFGPQFQYLNHAMLGYLLVSVLVTAHGLPWMIKFQFLFFEMLRLQVGFSKDAFLQFILFQSGSDIIAKLEKMLFVGYDQLSIPELFVSQEKTLIMAAIDTRNFLSLSGRIFKKAQGYNSSGETSQQQKELEVFMAQVLSCFTINKVNVAGV